jgi:hypothetical protein
MKPVARKDGLIFRQLPGELLVYDKVRHRAHCLNAPAAVVFKHSDGKTSVKELAKRLRREMGGGSDEAWVWLALEQLDEAHLLEDAASAPAPLRREILKRLGCAAALPVVISLLAPTPASAAASCQASCSGQPDGTPCQLGPGDQCFSPAICCQGTCQVGTC